jgi:hypothetical protein
MRNDREVKQQEVNEELVPAGTLEMTDETLESELAGGSPPTSCTGFSCKAWG